MFKHRAHPWHGITLGDKTPQVVTTFIEIVPTDTVKYEIDKPSGYLSIDRPQKYSNIVPALYGFLPRTYCGAKVAELTNQALNRKDVEGDGDPLDICVLTEKDVTHGDIIVKAKPIGGLRLLDRNQADDKIIAVLQNSLIYSEYEDISQLPETVVERLVHYFTTYKDLPSDKTQRMQLVNVYGVEAAYDVIQRSVEDYKNGLHDFLKKDRLTYE
ncbi:MAG: inorganic pyrophosphatase [Tannerellaceae bacterium]|nr:inorganic pyrophosphatase [Tannerellaceae bacterium]